MSDLHPLLAATLTVASASICFALIVRFCSAGSRKLTPGRKPHTDALAFIRSPIPLPPLNELRKFECACGATMGPDGHADVYEKDGVTYLASVRCAKCEQAQGDTNL